MSANALLSEGNNYGSTAESFESTLNAFDAIIPIANEIARASIEDHKTREDKHYISIMKTIQGAMQNKELYKNGKFGIAMTADPNYFSLYDSRFRSIIHKMLAYRYKISVSDVDCKPVINVTKP
jgi:hypothetical protein